MHGAHCRSKVVRHVSAVILAREACDRNDGRSSARTIFRRIEAASGESVSDKRLGLEA